MDVKMVVNALLNIITLIKKNHANFSAHHQVVNTVSIIFLKVKRRKV
jgi:hypothetical protein